MELTEEEKKQQARIMQINGLIGDERFKRYNILNGLSLEKAQIFIVCFVCLTDLDAEKEIMALGVQVNHYMVGWVCCRCAEAEIRPLFEVGVKNRLDGCSHCGLPSLDKKKFAGHVDLASGDERYPCIDPAWKPLFLCWTCLGPTLELAIKRSMERLDKEPFTVPQST